MNFQQIIRGLYSISSMLISGCIPNTVHFIWVGSSFPDRYIDNITDWATLNPHYNIFVWTEPDRMMMPTKAPLWSEELDRVDLIDRAKAQFVRYPNIQVKNIYCEELQNIIDDSGVAPFLYDEMHGSDANYGAASDILRLLVLFVYGGIYMDCDTYPSEERQPFPSFIRARYGFLVSFMRLPDGGTSLTNSVIASCKCRETDFIFYYLKGIVDNYNRLYRLRRDVHRHRSRHPNYQYLREMSTLSTTGPFSMNDFLTDFQDGTFGELRGQAANKVVGNEKKYDTYYDAFTQELSDYIFPTQYVRIESERNWI